MAVDGKMWRIDFENKRKAFEMKLHSVEGNDDQRWAYKLAMTWTNLSLVGVPGSGKTWVIKNLGLLLESIFFKPGEMIFCSPLGRVAMNLHPDARTIHRIIKIKPGVDRRFPESLEQLASHLGRIKPRPFTNLKLIVGTEMFMCTTPHLQSLLQFVHTSLQNMDVKVLFDGDPIQLPPQHSALRHHWPRRRLHKQIMRWQRSLRSSTPGVPVDHISSPVSPSSRSVHRSRCICARFDLRGIIEDGQLEQSVFF